MSTGRVRQIWSHLTPLFVLVLAALAFSSAPAHPVHASPLPTLPHLAAVEPAAPSTLLQFTSHGQALGFQTDGFYVSNGTYALHVQFVDAQPVAPASDTPSTESRPGAPPLSGVTYANLWDGITLTYDTSRGGVMSSTYRLEPQADWQAIHLRYNAPVTLNADGTLTVAYATGEISESAPEAWQEVAGVRVPVRVAFESRGQRAIGFAVGEYDARLALFIDPTLTWNTFLGGTGNDTGYAVAVDGNGNIYVAGDSTATWGSPFRAYTSGDDAFAAKLSSSGTLIWNTFLGGSGNDYGFGVAVDGNRNVYVAGQSAATWGSPARAYTGGNDAFVAKIDAIFVLHLPLMMR